MQFWPCCFQITLKQESRRHFQQSSFSWDLITSLLTKQVLIICAWKVFFISLPIPNQYVAEKMFIYMRSGPNTTLSYTYDIWKHYYLVHMHITFHVSVNKKSNIDKLQRNTETIHIAYPTVVKLDSHPFVNIKEVTFQRSMYLFLCKVR